MISANETTVIGFSLTGSTIPAGEGVLVVLDVTGDGDACLTDVILSDSAGEAIDQTVEDCTSIVEAGDDCPSGNYDCAGVCDGDAEEDCDGECGGSAEVDDCGVCGGDNSSCADCAGVPNGDAELDECGVCDGCLLYTSDAADE